MTFKWFDTTQINELADEMIGSFISHIPLSDIEKGGSKAERRLAEAEKHVLELATKYAGSNKINLFQKSHLPNRVKWKLIEAGYPKMMVDDLAYRIVAAVTKKRSK
jgi:hypothetical protein